MLWRPGPDTRRWHFPWVGFGLAVLAAACTSDGAPDATTTEPRPTSSTAAPSSTTEAALEGGGTVSFSLGEPLFIDPQLVGDVLGFEVARLLFDGLTVLSPEGGTAAPGVARSWETNADRTVWTFNLRDDVTFSNGRQVVASDFVYAWSRAADPDLTSNVAYHGSLAGIVGWDEISSGEPSNVVGDEIVSGVVALGDLTLEVTLNAPNALLPKILSHPVFSPIPREVIEADPEGWGEMPIGNGPYQMSEPWEHQVGIRLERSAGYYGTAGLPDEIDFRIYVSTDAAFLDVQAGDLDIAVAVPPEHVESARRTFGERFLETPTGQFVYIGLPKSVAAFQNADLRRALLMAIDREAITERILAGEIPANGFVPPVAIGALSDACPYCMFDPAAAKDLYESSGGLPNDETIIYFSLDLGPEEAVVAVANDWQVHLGVTVAFEQMDFGTFVDFLFAEEGPNGPFAIGWVWDYPSAYNFLAPLYQCGSPDNLSGFCNINLDEQLNLAITAASEEAGIPFLQEAQRIVGNEIPVIPIAFGLYRGVHSGEMSNVVITDLGYTLLEDVVVNR